MDAIDVIILILMRAPLVLPLVYVLAILLRVACHFAGVEIPALGRAFATAGATTLLTGAAALILRANLGDIDGSSEGLISLFLTLLLSLFANMLVATGLYRLLLSVNYNQALTVWLIQAMSFVAFAAAAGCLVGVPAMLIFD